jgi:hypothetical protein
MPSDVRRWLCPAESSSLIRGYAPDVLGPSASIGRIKGIARESRSSPSAGHSHRRTSDGIAESTWPTTFEGKAAGRHDLPAGAGLSEWAMLLPRTGGLFG